ncbi:MAG: VWA domain-containing protein [Candidatus Pacebacteria bacterium]|nr:VWA domain-containing protein [Candidatus Paceibacterota bacterium]
MKKTSKNTAYGILAVVLSGVLHVGLLWMADTISVSAFPLAGDKPTKPRRMRLETIDIRERVLGATKIDTVKFTRDTADMMEKALEDSSRVREILEDESLLKAPKPKLELKGLGKKVVLPTPEKTAPPQPPSAPRPELLTIDADELADEALTGRHVIAKVPREPADDDMLPSLLHEGPREGSGGALGVGMRLVMPDSEPDLSSMIKRAEDEGNGNREPHELTPAGDLPPLPGTEPGSSQRTTDRGEHIQAIDQLLDLRMVVHRPENGHGYFRVDIRPNPRSDRLQAIPKDVLFLIDRSNSISPPKLKVFKEAALQALMHLNRADRFNVVSFRVEPDNLFNRYVDVTDSNLEKAREYISGLWRGGLTDVYAGLAPFVGAEEAHAARPLTVFIFTDGQSTVKDKLDNETLIRRIDNENRDQVSIYSASCGEDANRFLLDLLAYSNRGVPLHEEKLENFEAKITGYIRTHSDVIVSSLEINATGRIADDVYPKKLPHLYRGETLSIYGRYPRGLDEIAIQVTGRSADNKLTEFIFHGNPAEAPEVGEELIYDWVAQKAFHLVLQRILTQSPAVAAELDKLVEQYNLHIPYL